MRLYVHASFLLSIVLGEVGAEMYAEIWDTCVERYSSLLLWAECAVTLRRLGVYKEREAFARQMLDGVNLVAFSRSVVDRIEHESGLAQCRTLDAIHLASALELGERAGDFVVACLDNRMREAAEIVSIALYPVVE